MAEAETTVGEVVDYAESRRGEWVDTGGGFLVKWMATMEFDAPLDNVLETGTLPKWRVVDQLEEPDGSTG